MMENVVITEAENLAKDISVLYLNEKFSDIVLNIEGTKLYAHKMILAARSEYFEAMLYGGLEESTEHEVTLKDVSLDAFRILLKYIYTGTMTIEVSNINQTLEVLGLANQFLFTVLQSSLIKQLKPLLNLDNIYSVLNTANLYNLYELQRSCHAFMDQHALKVLADDGFKDLTKESVINLLRRDTFFAPEIEIFRGISKWFSSNAGDKDMVTKCVRLSWVSVVDLMSEVWPSMLVNNDTLLHSIAENVGVKPRRSSCRAELLADENIASPGYKAEIITGKDTTYLLTGNRDVRRYAHHPLDDTNGITIKLANPTVINNIHMKLLDQDTTRSYSYFIEVSVELKQWKRIVDYRHYSCRSVQNLFFPQEITQYIRVVGTHDSANSGFHLIFFEAYYKSNIPKVVKGIVCPTTNVATEDMKATVIAGSNPTFLINGDTTIHDDRSTYYTYHTINSGAIVVRLAQPYVISRMKLLLWDKDSRFYHYYIESSLDYKNWEMVVDRRNERCKSWQNLQFKKMPMVYIRITGTHNSSNESYFHCVHFECL